MQKMKTEDVHACVTVNNEDHLMSLIDHDPVLQYACMHAVTSSIMQLSFIKFHFANCHQCSS